jgi:uncharacterized protein YegP (UPF0339 family)
MSEPLRVIFYEDASGEWRWQVRAGNERVIADSAEGYVNYGDALNGWRLIQQGAKDAVIDTKDV